MAAQGNKPPPYATVLPTNMNPNHAGYDQGGNQGFAPVNQGFAPVNQGFVAAPQGAMVMQQTAQGGPVMSSNTVVVTNQPQPTFVIGRTRGSDLTIPAILVCFFCCWCTGVPAIIYASKAQNEYGAGNWDEAESNQRTARGWILGSVITHIALWVVFVILYFTVIAVWANKAESDFDNSY